MTKKIALVVMARHITSLGGIGFYVDSFIKESKNRFIVDLIVDRPVKVEDIPFESIKESKIICSPQSSSYGTSSNFLMFHDDLSFYEIHSNTILSLTEAFKTNLYDCIFVNSVEMAVSIKHANFDEIVPVIVYAHNFYYQLPEEKFLKTMGYMNAGVFHIPHMTSIPEKRIDFIKDLTESHLITSEYDLLKLTKANTEPGTAFFNATFRDSKKPKDFVEFCRVHKKKALIITNSKGKTFFQTEFDALGISYEIKTHVFGQEKIDFISRGEVMFHPSEKEMMGYAVLEALFFMPVITYKEQWSTDYPPGILKQLDQISDFDDSMIDDSTLRRQWVTTYLNSEKTLDGFEKFIDDRTPKFSKSTSPSLKKVQDSIKSSGGISINDYWKQIKNRDSISFFDLVTLYKIRSQITKISYSSDETYFGECVEKEKDSLTFE